MWSTRWIILGSDERLDEVFRVRWDHEVLKGIFVPRNIGEVLYIQPF